MGLYYDNIYNEVIQYAKDLKLQSFMLALKKSCDYHNVEYDDIKEEVFRRKKLKNMKKKTLDCGWLNRWENEHDK